MSNLVEATGGRTHAERVATFLEFACWDHHTHGKGDHRMYDRAAQRLLAQHPEIARDSLYTAVVCGDLEEVERILAERPEAARESGGSRGWTPLLYLCYTRFTHEPTIDRAVEIARMLLDHGADPNGFYMAGDSEYSALVGAAGEGEQDSPRQPYAEGLYRLLLERGAGPYDIQVLYNTHFSCDMIWWLELTYQHSLKAGRKADWDDPRWSMLDMGGYGPGAYFILNAALERNNLRLAEWALTHGASPNADTSSNPKFKPKHALYEVAVLLGQIEMAQLLGRYGTGAVTALFEPDEAFIGACMRLDRPAARAILERHPEYLRSHRAMFEAAKRDRTDVIAFLLDLGVPLEVEDRRKTRALHQAAASNTLRAAAFLIERGAEIDPRETNYHNTPLGWAAHYDHVDMLDLLSHYSRDVWYLAFCGYADRVRQVLHAEPDLATQVTPDGITPLWWLPDDEAKAREIVDLFLSHGADPSIRSKDGRMAADWALKRGMIEAARKLAVDDAADRPPAPAPDLEKYESLAKDLVFAYETGHAAAMQRVQEYAGRSSLTWEELRAGVRQRLDAIPDAEKPGGYVSLPQARLFIARQAGFDNWAELVKAIEVSDPPAAVRTPISPPLPQPDLTAPGMIQPVEMRMTLPVQLQDGVYSTTTEVWNMLTASRDGHIERVTEMVARCPSLVHCDYNYMRPLHLAVREGHVEVVRHLLDHGAADPKYVTYPYNETLMTMAQDHGYHEIAQLLVEHYSRPGLPDIGDSGDIKYGKDEAQRKLEQLVNADALAAAEALLKARPELALDETAFWSEGVLMMPAKGRQRGMLELLMRYGARVPDISKWGREYYFKHYDIAVFLMDHGMNPNHMNCHHTTLLHAMAQGGDVRKAQLLLDRGADLNAVDEEFRSTPLGFATRWGHREMVALLLERGADPNRSGAPWATPLAWAQTKGHHDIEADLRRAGAD